MADAGRPSSVVALQHWRHFPDRWLADVRDPDSEASAPNSHQRWKYGWKILIEAGTGQRRTVRFFSESGVPMPFQAILREVDQLQNVSTRFEALADRHPLVSDPLTTIALSVRNTATLLEVLVAAKGPKPI